MTTMTTIIEKPWGKEEILEVNEFYVVKRLTMNDGCRCSLQYHKEKKETIYVLEGELTIHLRGYNSISENVYFPGQIVTIDPHLLHRMEAKKGNAIYLECSTTQLNDVVRIEDDYNRK